MKWQCFHCVQQVVCLQQHYVRPTKDDASNENVLTEECKAQTDLPEDDIKNGQPLEHVLDEVCGTLTLEKNSDLQIINPLHECQWCDKSDMIRTKSHERTVNLTEPTIILQTTVFSSLKALDDLVLQADSPHKLEPNT